MRHESVVGVEHLARHAIGASEIAAIGDRDAQVMQRTPARIFRWAQGARRPWLRVGSGPCGMENDFAHDLILIFQRPARSARAKSGPNASSRVSTRPINVAS